MKSIIILYLPYWPSSGSMSIYINPTPNHAAGRRDQPRSDHRTARTPVHSCAPAASMLPTFSSAKEKDAAAFGWFVEIPFWP